VTACCVVYLLMLSKYSPVSNTSSSPFRDSKPKMSLRSLSGPRLRSSASTPVAYEHIKVEKLTPTIGATVSGIDLARPTEAQIAELKLALEEHFVLFFRNQSMTTEEHLALGRQFGDLDVHPAAPNGGDPALMTIHTDEKSLRANGEGWHSGV